MRHTRTMPSSPPLITLLLSDVDAIAVTAFWCASWMVYSSLPLCGANARILPSDQPLMMDLPSVEKATHAQSRLGTAMRSSSRHVARCHTRMLPRPAVANTSLYSWGKARSLIFSLCAVCSSSSLNLPDSGSYVTLYMLHDAVPTRKVYTRPRTSSRMMVVMAPSSFRLARRAIFLSILGLAGSGSSAVRSTLTLPSPPPTRTSPVGHSQMAVAPSCTGSLPGPLFLNSTRSRATCSTSPVVVPQYANWSLLSMQMLLKMRCS
mmetsp:Transcript_27678/g.70496  ORF Transcript_27678/g.70496 Transcript_27678/m.70496 type:complete len:263 (-) Transcript_27678:574-1362(-)